MNIYKLGFSTLLIVLTGCSIPSFSIGGTDGDEQIFFGIVKIETPEIGGSVVAYKHAGLGLSVGHDLILGWNKGKHVFVPITDKALSGGIPEAPCQIVIFVESDEDAVFTNQLLAQFDEGIVCTANF